MSATTKQTQQAANVIQRVLAAYGSQRDQVGDSDLDNEQPISLSLHLTLGDIRAVRQFISRFRDRCSMNDQSIRDELMAGAA